VIDNYSTSPVRFRARVSKPGILVCMFCPIWKVRSLPSALGGGGQPPTVDRRVVQHVSVSSDVGIANTDPWQWHDTKLLPDDHGSVPVLLAGMGRCFTNVGCR